MIFSFTRMERATLLALCLGLSAGCAGSSGAAEYPNEESTDVDPKEARKVVEAYIEKYQLGARSAAAPAPTSMGAVRDIVLGDRISEYDAARSFMAGKQGPEVLSIRALLELSEASAYSTAESVLKEMLLRMNAELDQLRRNEEAGGKVDEAAMKRLKTEIADTRDVVAALPALADTRLRAGQSLVAEAVRRHPDDPAVMLAQAHLYRLKGQWQMFDRVSAQLEQLQQDSASVLFLRGMEAYERDGDKARCRKFLEAALGEQPKLVRAQATLVLVQDSVAQTYAEMQRLRQLSPDHFLVRIAGKIVDENYRVAAELQAQ